MIGYYKLTCNLEYNIKWLLEMWIKLQTNIMFQLKIIKLYKGEKFIVNVYIRQTDVDTIKIK
jgi:hypothetical protein